MKKNKYFFLILFMSLALIGIILVQSFWIKTTIDNRERQFSLNVNQALIAVTESIRDREMRNAHGNAATFGCILRMNS